MVGQYHGPDGSEAMGIIAPFWNIIYSFGLLAEIGASVLFAVEKNIKAIGILINILPVIFNPSSIWLSMPITEAMTAIFAVVSISASQKNLTSSKKQKKTAQNVRS